MILPIVTETAFDPARPDCRIRRLSLYPTSATTGKEMNCKTLLTPCACIAALAIPSLCQAHFLWASLDSKTKTLAIGLQEVPAQEPLPLGERAALVRALLPSGRVLDLKADGNWFRAQTPESCVGANLDYGVIDRRDSGRGVFWLEYYAKAATTLGSSQVKLGLPVELFTTQRNDGSPMITVLRDGKPAAGADLVVEDATGKTTFERKTEADGTATLLTVQGPIAVRALITENAPGTHGGKPYDLIRIYSTLTVQDPSAMPLTRLLRDSFGDMHDVVSRSAFIETVMAGDLTKSQLESHLAQRALVNEAVDQVLRRARVRPLPYGKPQREVLSLRRDNMRDNGFARPGPSAAWPLTQALLSEIKESARKGPYFALGVFHVYYGGITHGGRDIGDAIDRRLKTHLTYYEESAGYEEYARQVDEITDPEAEQEMIRGADEAYRTIIAVNSLEVFGQAKSIS